MKGGKNFQMHHLRKRLLFTKNGGHINNPQIWNENTYNWQHCHFFFPTLRSQVTTFATQGYLHLGISPPELASMSFLLSK